MLTQSKQLSSLVLHVLLWLQHPKNTTARQPINRNRSRLALLDFEAAHILIAWTSSDGPHHQSMFFFDVFFFSISRASSKDVPKHSFNPCGAADGSLDKCTTLMHPRTNEKQTFLKLSCSRVKQCMSAFPTGVCVLVKKMHLPSLLLPSSLWVRHAKTTCPPCCKAANQRGSLLHDLPFLAALSLL